MSERGGHDEILTRDVELHELHEREKLEILRGHEADRDLEDVELVLLTKMQQEIERPLEGGQRDRVLGGAPRRLCTGRLRYQASPHTLAPPLRQGKGHATPNSARTRSITKSTGPKIAPSTLGGRKRNTSIRSAKP